MIIKAKHKFFFTNGSFVEVPILIRGNYLLPNDYEALDGLRKVHQRVPYDLDVDTYSITFMQKFSDNRMEQETLKLELSIWQKVYLKFVNQKYWISKKSVLNKILISLITTIIALLVNRSLGL